MIERHWIGRHEYVFQDGPMTPRWTNDYKATNTARYRWGSKTLIALNLFPSQPCLFHHVQVWFKSCSVLLEHLQLHVHMTVGCMWQRQWTACVDGGLHVFMVACTC